MAAWCRVLEKELADLVAAGQVQARIDSHSKVLYARLTDTRAATFERALKTGARPPPQCLSCDYSPQRFTSVDHAAPTCANRIGYFVKCAALSLPVNYKIQLSLCSLR